MPFFVFAVLLVCSVSIVAQSDSPRISKDEKAQIEHERRPNPKKLFDSIRAADSVKVTYGSDGETKTLFESSGRRDIDELEKALKLRIPKDWRLSVCADPTITLYRNGEIVAIIGDVSGREIRTNIWGANAEIVDQEAWLRWFDDRGIPVVRKERDHAIAMEKLDAKNRARWYAAMPVGAKIPFEKASATVIMMLGRSDPLLKASIDKNYPDKFKRIRAILRWYGSGEVSWSGYPGYEQVAGNLLFDFSTEEIVKALEGTGVSGEHFEGAARHFAGWDFSQQRPNDLNLLSPELKKRLLDQALINADEDKKARAKEAFQTAP